jgi:hypothetical protein
MTTKLSSVIALFVVAWCATVYSADPVYPDRPKNISITGALLPPGAEAREDLVTVNIYLKGNPRLLRVGKIEDLTADEKDRAVKDDILIRQVRFYGPDEIMKRLQLPDIVGRVITIEGRLDVKEKRFLVKSVREAAGEEILSPTKEH